MLGNELIGGKIDPKLGPQKKWYEREYPKYKFDREAFWARRMNELRTEPTPKWLRDAAKDPRRFMHRDFLGKRFLQDSVFYTCAGNDGRPIRHWRGLAHSFLYMDSCYDEAWVARGVKPWSLKGYECFFQERVPMLSKSQRYEVWDDMETELDKKCRPPEYGYYAGMGAGDDPWCADFLQEEFKAPVSQAWICLLRRKRGVGPEHGPRLLSVCLIAGGAITYYYHFYNRNGIVPKALCTHNPGMCDWVGIHQPNGVFRDVVRMNSAGLPKLNICESIFEEHSLLLYEDSDWRVPSLWALPEESMYGVKRGNLILAADNGEYEACRKLLKRGADPNAQDNNGWTALHGATFNGNRRVAELLLDSGADPNARDRKGMTPLMYSAEEPCYVETTRLLLERGADPNRADNENLTPLMHAVTAPENVGTIGSLLDSGARINDKGSGGETALSYAAFKGNLRNCEFLLENGADPNGGAELGWTPLCGASKGGNGRIFRMLVRRGADFHFKGEYGSYFKTIANDAPGCFVGLDICQIERLIKEGGLEKL